MRLLANGAYARLVPKGLLDGYALWVARQYVLRTKSNKYIQQKEEEYQQLISLGLKPGKSFYLKQVNFTKQTGMSRVNLAFYWSKITNGKRKNEGWYLINNLGNLQQTIKAYLTG